MAKMRTDEEISSYVRSLDLDTINILEAKYLAMLKAHSFCGISTRNCNKHVSDVATDTVDKMLEVNNG